MLDRAQAQDWYQVDRLEHGITHIQERFIDPFYRCNIWHVQGRDRDLLFDSGMGVVSLTQMLPWLCQRPLLAVASHTHFDHIGCHHEFEQRACHIAEASVMANPCGHETLSERYAVIEMFEQLPPDGYEQSQYRVRSAPATQVLEAGDVIDLGDRQFEVLHVPGHSPGSIALWEAATGVLLSGDAVYDGPLLDDNHHSHIPSYLESMQRLRALPVSVVHGGHFASFGRARFVELIDQYIAGKRSPGCPSH